MSRPSFAGAIEPDLCLNLRQAASAVFWSAGNFPQWPDSGPLNAQNGVWPFFPSTDLIVCIPARTVLGRLWSVCELRGNVLIMVL
jgi:hypothetical protein